MIRIRNLNKTYYGGAPLHVLKGINMEVEKNEFLSIMGSSGSGKSTLLNILGILDTYDTGEYYLDDVLIQNLSETRAADLRNQKIGFIFQSFNLISFKNAMENVALPLYYQGVSRKKRNILAMEYLDKMGLKSHADHLPNELSGGQKQRVAIARALIAQPKIILADEPTGALDSKTSEEVMRILREVNSLDGVAMIIVTHEHAVAEATDRIIHIKDGIISSNEIVKDRQQNEREKDQPTVVRLEEPETPPIVNEIVEEDIAFDDKKETDNVVPVSADRYVKEKKGEALSLHSIEIIEEKIQLESSFNTPVDKDALPEVNKTDNIIEVAEVQEEPVQEQEEKQKTQLLLDKGGITETDAGTKANSVTEQSGDKVESHTDTKDSEVETVTENLANTLESNKKENDNKDKNEKTVRKNDPNRRWQYI